MGGATEAKDLLSDAEPPRAFLPNHLSLVSVIRSESSLVRHAEGVFPKPLRAVKKSPREPVGEEETMEFT